MIKNIFICMAAALFLCAGAASYIFAEEYTDPSKAIEITRDSNVRIVLESNRTTGFEWQLKASPAADVLEFIGSEYIAGDSEVLGSEGKEIWRFRAVGIGKTSVSLEYARPWEKDIPPAKTREFSVIVKEDTTVSVAKDES